MKVLDQYESINFLSPCYRLHDAVISSVELDEDKKILSIRVCEISQKNSNIFFTNCDSYSACFIFSYIKYYSDAPFFEYAGYDIISTSLTENIIKFATSCGDLRCEFSSVVIYLERSETPTPSF